MQRIGLFEELSAIYQPAFVPPNDPVEEALAAIWAEVLGVETVGALDNFLALGGDSVGRELVSRVEGLLKMKPALGACFARRR